VRLPLEDHQLGVDRQHLGDVGLALVAGLDAAPDGVEVVLRHVHHPLGAGHHERQRPRGMAVGIGVTVTGRGSTPPVTEGEGSGQAVGGEREPREQVLAAGVKRADRARRLGGGRAWHRVNPNVSIQ